MGRLGGDDRNDPIEGLRKERPIEFKRAEKVFATDDRECLTSGVILNLGYYYPNVYSTSLPILSDSGGFRYTINGSAPPSILNADVLPRQSSSRLNAMIVGKFASYFPRILTGSLIGR